jgi:uncharacterized protein with HEPN domain
MKNDLVYLGHMYDNACKAVEKLAGRTRDDFDADDTLQLALVYLVQTVGESARRVSEETRVKHPEIPFRQIVGMRHKVVHDYMSVDLDIVYNVVTKDLPPLIEVLARIIPLEQ